MKKIVLKKTVVANLSNDTMDSLKGGGVPNTFGEDTCFRPDPPFSVICQHTRDCPSAANCGGELVPKITLQQGTSCQVICLLQTEVTCISVAICLQPNL